MKAILKKEFATYFRSPLGYVFCAAYLLFSSIYFQGILTYGVSNYFTDIYAGMRYFVLLLIPILTMRLFSEERKHKTDQVLITSPVSITSIVLGKFFAAFTVYSVCVLFTLVYAVVMSLFVSPPWMLILGNIVGTLFYGATFIALGLFISSTTENQTVAAILTFTVNIILMLIDAIVPMFTNNKYIISIVSWVSFAERYDPFTIGVLDFSSLIYFLSVCAIFIFFTVRVIERRRWS